jgi:tetratricopeptide (TPR) repeat protein
MIPAMDRPSATSLLAFAEAANPAMKGADSKDAFAEVDARYEGLLGAIDWFVGNDATDDALRIVNALFPFWIEKQRFDDGWAAYGRALSAPNGDQKLRAAAWINAGFMPFWSGDDVRASGAFDRGLTMSRELGDSVLEARALGGLTRIALRSDVAEGRRLAREQLAFSDATGNVAGRSDALHLLGVGAQIAGDLGEARDWMRQRLAVVREQNNETLIASEAGNLSMVERQLGNLDVAEALIRESLEIAERRGDEFMKPFALSGFAAIATERGEYVRAARLVGAAEAIMAAQNMAWPPDEKPHYERMLAILPDRMGAADFEGARAAGRSMSTAAAVALALGAPIVGSAPT